MIKDILLTCARCGLGFILIAPLFVYANTSGHLPSSTSEVPNDPVYVWFFQGVMAVWLLTVVANVVLLLKVLPEFPSSVAAALRWSPVYLPLLYGATTYLWFFGAHIL